MLFFETKVFFHDHFNLYLFFFLSFINKKKVTNLSKVELLLTQIIYEIHHKLLRVTEKSKFTIRQIIFKKISTN